MFDNITTTEETETIVRRSMTIVLSEEEATAALVNPGKLLKRIRAERAKWHEHPAWSQTGHADGRPRKKADKKAAEKKIPQGFTSESHCNAEMPALPRLVQAARQTLTGVPGAPQRRYRSILRVRGASHEHASHHDRFCPRCQLRLTAENPLVGDRCSWCVAEQRIGHVVTYVDLQ